MKKINVMVYMAFMVTLEIICTRFLAIETPIIRIGFGFIPVAMAGMMFGPLLAGIVGVVSDILGMIIFPKGAYFPGFTLSAFVGAVIYGFFFYRKNVSLKRVILAVGIITLFVNLTMNTIWLTIITGKAAKILLIPRSIKEATMFPIHIVLIYTVWKLVDKFEFVPRLITKSNK
ncbi:folate family ECF transporter S component [Clostridium botulinum]|uniref:folate family ECF transporter S component n=1 Tax=Clostridium botulinum TaxID=1491 RepID=UPI000316B14B|nr:folate family ECF transporter S component [Clostridium botulinum]KEI01054.1 folate transporter [Clostridium botulinum D str. 16868]KEI04765.1 folate transporter [Clostridium botulinum C/D str. Sp77]